MTPLLETREERDTDNQLQALPTLLSLPSAVVQFNSHFTLIQMLSCVGDELLFEQSAITTTRMLSAREWSGDTEANTSN